MTPPIGVMSPAVPVGRKTRAPLALALVAVALMAMAVVPIYLGQKAAAVQDEITQTLLPSIESAARLSLLQARQMARFQSFLLTGEGSYRLAYGAAIPDEDSLYTTLSERVRVMDFDVRERLAQLSGESTRWHFDNQAAFDQVKVPVGTDSEIQLRSLTAYESLQRATRELERAIQSEVNTGRRRLEDVRLLQIWISIVLSVLAFGSTLAIVRVGHRLRGFISEAERRRNDAVLARREIDALLEATGDGVLGIGLDGKCSSLNRVGCELLGYTERDIQGRDVHDTVYHSFPSGEPRSRDESPILAALRDGARADSADDDVLWARAREALPARWALHPLMDGLQLRGAVLTFTDMTEIREKEEALHRAVSQREEVVSIVSHDLRNPLGVVAACAELLIDLPLDDGERLKQAEIIARSAGRMRRLIDDLLDVSRIEAGAFVVRPSAEMPGPILEEARALFADQADAAGITLSIDPSETAPVRLDRDRVLQGLANLIDNALRFTPRGGNVLLCAHNADAHHVALTVSDDGAGMPPQTLEHLFDRYWQADSMTPGAAGLGLAIVRGVAEAHGGSVTVDSTVGQGTTFAVLLPVAERAPEPVE